jgi:hypothetical protein
MSNFLSGTAVVLSTISLAFSGFTTYQLFEQQKKISSFENTISNVENKFKAIANSSPQIQSNSANNLIPASNTTSSQSETTTTTPTTPQTSGSVIEFQPGQLVKPIGNGKGELEFVSIKRIQNPDTNKRDLVLVKMNVRYFDYTGGWSIGLYNFSVTANNPETYDEYDFIDGTGTINMNKIAKGTTAGAFMKIQIPENVKLVDIFIEDVEAFKNVSIPS